MGVYGEVVVRFIDIRSQHVQPHALAFVHEGGYLGNVRKVVAQVGCHEFRRVMGFQETGLVGDVGVANRVRFVERIGGECFPVSPDFVDQRFHVFAVFLRSLDKFRIVLAPIHELVFQLRHGFQLFLTHGLAQRVRHASGEISQGAGLEHHLFLIYRDAVGVFQERFHHRVVVLDRFFAVLALDELRDVFHRPRTVQGVHGNQIFEAVGLQGTQVLFHTGRLELEQPCGFAPGE